MADKWNTSKTERKTKPSAEEILVEAIEHCEVLIKASEATRETAIMFGLHKKDPSGFEAGFDRQIKEYEDMLRILRGEATAEIIFEEKKRSFEEKDFAKLLEIFTKGMTDDTDE